MVGPVGRRVMREAAVEGDGAGVFVCSGGVAGWWAHTSA